MSMNTLSIINTSISTRSLFRRRLLGAKLLIFTCFALLIARFVYLQVIKYDVLSQKSASNSTSMVPIPPERGQIFDRHGFVLAHNNTGFSLEITLDDLERLEKESIDDALARTISQIQTFIPIQDADLKRFKSIRQESVSHDSIPIRFALTEDEVARFSVKQFHFKGVEIKKRMFREYPNGPLGVHVVGYVGRINKSDSERLKEKGILEAYRGTSYIGKLGIEQSYESTLHGKPGFVRLQVTASGRTVEELGSEPAVNGMNVRLTIDALMQGAIEKGFSGRKGALVAIEPSTGEVLAFVSSPTFDPNLFLSPIDNDMWRDLNDKDKGIPMLNRALRGGYPVGSTYKPFMALAALRSGVRSADKVIADGGVYNLGGHKFRDSTGGRGHGMVNMFQSIAVSSDVYYYSLAYEMGIDTMYQELSRFGFGQKTNIDLIGELPGLLPSRDWYFKKTGKQWNEGQTVSLGIGQGENTFTMMQLAYATSIIANNGVGMKPHLLKSIVNPKTGVEKVTEPIVQADLKIPEADLDIIRRGMIQVNISGTGRGIFNSLPGQVAGKTGTAQVITIGQKSTYGQTATRANLKDHSLYIAFYPAEKPRVAIAAIVENAGFGATAAAPLVRVALQAFNDSNNAQRTNKLVANQTNKANEALSKQ